MPQTCSLPFSSLSQARRRCRINRITLWPSSFSTGAQGTDRPLCARHHWYMHITGVYCIVFSVSRAQQVYSRALPRSCLLSAACTAFPPFRTHVRCPYRSKSYAFVVPQALSLCSRGDTRARQRLLLLRSRAMTKLFVVSLCRRRSFTEEFRRMLMAYCGGALVHQLQRSTPGVGGTLA